ncbi:hypothetical protein [Kitasatospora sp. LaBMicrA B282]|uniref:hypothetical protein n=1 Tax=Kitasatospora sp. LaBMicrA B282 TaxID=3420949 RepID=UPI003D0FE8D3
MSTQDSAAFLAEHADDLLAPDADAALLAMGQGRPDLHRTLDVHRAILALVRTDGIDATYTLLTDRQALDARLGQAVAAADGPALTWLSRIEGGVHDAQWAAVVHWLAARALEPDRDSSSSATDLAEAETDPPLPEERARAVSELAALMTACPTRAAALGALLQAVLTTEVQPSEG